MDHFVLLMYCKRCGHFSGLSVLYGMTMGGMTSMLTNIDARRAEFVHRYKAFEKHVVSVCSECLKLFAF